MDDIRAPSGRTTRTPRIGFAFSGGAVRGFAHVGVLEVLYEAGIYPDMTIGVSAGSIIAALVAAQIPLQRIGELVRVITWRQLARPAFPSRMGLFTLKPMARLLEQETGVHTIEELPLTFACGAFDVEREEFLVLKEGPLASAVQASCSVPGIFTPVKREGRLLVDGGIFNNLPVKALREMGADFVIAVDVMPKGSTPRPPRHMFDLLSTAFFNMIRANSHERALADVVIEPQIRWETFWNMKYRERLLEQARQAARAALPTIRQKLRAWAAQPGGEEEHD